MIIHSSVQSPNYLFVARTHSRTHALTHTHTVICTTHSYQHCQYQPPVLSSLTVMIHIHIEQEWFPKINLTVAFNRKGWVGFSPAAAKAKPRQGLRSRKERAEDLNQEWLNVISKESGRYADIWHAGCVHFGFCVKPHCSRVTGSPLGGALGNRPALKPLVLWSLCGIQREHICHGKHLYFSPVTSQLFRFGAFHKTFHGLAGVGE